MPCGERADGIAIAVDSQWYQARPSFACRLTPPPRGSYVTTPILGARVMPSVRRPNLGIRPTQTGEPMTLAGKTFRAIANSSNGTIGTDTTMTFVSEDERGILGVYAGGSIRAGQVVARRKDDGAVEMLYQCVTTSHELKAGRALAH